MLASNPKSINYIVTPRPHIFIADLPATSMVYALI